MNTTRRRFLTAGAATIAGSTALLALPTNTQGATITQDSLDISDNAKSLQDPPSSVTLTVSGSYELTGTKPDQSRVVLQCEYAGTSRDMNEQVNLENVMTGDYELSAGLLEHPEVDASDLLPSEVGGTTGTEFTIRLILLAVTGGSIQQETHIEDTGMLSLTHEGLELSLGGSGSIEVNSD